MVGHLLESIAFPRVQVDLLLKLEHLLMLDVPLQVVVLLGPHLEQLFEVLALFLKLEHCIRTILNQLLIGSLVGFVSPW